MVRVTTRALVLIAVSACLAAPAVASTGGTYTFAGPGTLNDLDHYHFYTWGIDWTLPGDEGITSATLTFHDIWDWQPETDFLWVNLLDDAPSGLADFGYNSKDKGELNAYEEELAAGTGVALPGSPWDDPNGGDPSLATTVSFDVPFAYFGWMSDGNFGFGIDPDCHYYDGGVDLVIKTAPELPPVLLLTAVPVMGMVIGRFRRR